MKVVLISCFGYYEQRIKFVKEAFEEKGDEVTVLFSDFDHINKTKIQNEMEGIEYIHAKPYYKNMSIARIFSHYKFAVSAYKRVCEETPDVVYSIIPPNSLSRLLKKYKKSHKVKLIYDIYDLWPESFVNKALEKLAYPFFSYWRKLRNNSLDAADYVITECDLYQEILSGCVDHDKFKTIHLTKERDVNEVDLIKPFEELHVCYLGSINNIINTKLIKSFLTALKKHRTVVLDVIGKGETKDYFMREMRSIGIKIVDHGPLYGEEKRKVLDQCHFGINMMIDAAKVGLTMKSIDYFSSNLPLLNNIKGDTWQFVEKNIIGFNIPDNNIEAVAKQVAELKQNEYQEIVDNTKRIFDEKFSPIAFKRAFKDINNKVHTPKEKLNILVVSQYYYPEQFRITDVCENLVRAGHNVSVLTGLPNYPEGIVLDRYKRFKNRREKINGVDVVRSFLIGRGNNPYKLFLNYLSFMICASFKKHKLPLEAYDAIFVYEISPVTQIYPAYVYKKKYHCPMFVNCQDVWPEVIKVYGIKEKDILFKLVKKFSCYLYNKADEIIVSSKGFMDYLEDICKVPSVKMKYLPNHAENIYLEFNNEPSKQDKTHLLFAGNIGQAQNLITLIEAIHHIDDKVKEMIVVDIVGDGSYLNEFKEKVLDLKLSEQFVFHGKKRMDELHTYYELADAYILTLEGGTFVSNTVPGKLQGYMGAGKPILAAIDGQAQNIIDEAQCGLYCNAGDAIGYAEIIKEFIVNIEKYREMGNNGREYFKEYFTVDNYVSKLVEMIGRI